MEGTSHGDSRGSSDSFRKDCSCDNGIVVRRDWFHRVVMAGLVPATRLTKHGCHMVGVCRDKPGDDGSEVTARPFAPRPHPHIRFCVATLTSAGVPERIASKPRVSAGISCSAPSTFSPWPPQDSDHHLEIRRRIELDERHGVGLGGVALGIDVAGRLAHRAPGVVVGDDGERRQLLGAADIMIGERIAEIVGAVADRGDHLALGRRELGAEAAAEPEAEAAGEARAEIAARRPSARGRAAGRPSSLTMMASLALSSLRQWAR